MPAILLPDKLILKNKYLVPSNPLTPESVKHFLVDIFPSFPPTTILFNSLQEDITPRTIAK